MIGHCTDFINPGSSMETIVTEIIKTIKNPDIVIERDMAMRHFRNWQQGANGMSTSGMYIMHTAR